jgi:hypothetical protein
MPPVLTNQAVVTCAHGGQVVLVPKQTTVTIAGGAVMCVPDLLGAPIAGCAQPPTPATKPCTTVVAVLPGSWSLKVSVAGRPVYLATLAGLTDGVPPSPLIVAFPGQVIVQAQG